MQSALQQSQASLTTNLHTTLEAMERMSQVMEQMLLGCLDMQITATTEIDATSTSISGSDSSGSDSSGISTIPRPVAIMKKKKIMTTTSTTTVSCFNFVMVTVRNTGTLPIPDIILTAVMYHQSQSSGGASGGEKNHDGKTHLDSQQQQQSPSSVVILSPQQTESEEKITLQPGQSRSWRFAVDTAVTTTTAPKKAAEAIEVLVTGRVEATLTFASPGRGIPLSRSTSTYLHIPDLCPPLMSMATKYARGGGDAAAAAAAAAAAEVEVEASTAAACEWPVAVKQTSISAKSLRSYLCIPAAAGIALKTPHLITTPIGHVLLLKTGHKIDDDGTAIPVTLCTNPAAGEAAQMLARQLVSQLTKMT